MCLKSIIFVERYLKCGAEEDRTPDFLLAKQALSQLSYSPKFQNSPNFHLEKLGAVPTSLVLSWEVGAAPEINGPKGSRTTDLVLIRDAL